MFEKEAEEYRKDLKSKFFLSEPQLDFACQGFKDGFNKANEWHEDLPTKDMKLSEYGITDSEGVLHKFSTEKGVYKYLGVKYKEPWDR